MPVTEISSASDFAKVKASSKTKLVMVDFWATWCGPCRQVAPAIEAMSNKYDKQCSFYKLDVDRVQEVARGEGVSAMPTFKFYGNGNEVAEIRGGNVAAIEQQIQALSAKFTQQQAFSGSGHSLSDGSSNTAARAAPASGGPARRNPWADAGFADKMLKKSDKPAAAATPAAAPAERQAPAARGIADPNYKPPTPSVPPPSNPPASQPPASVAGDASAAGAATSQVDQNLLRNLTEMGFAPIRAEKALLNTGNNNVEAAMNWCLAHENDADIDTPIQPAASSSSAAPSSSTPAAAAAAAPKPAGGKKPIDWEEMDEDDRLIYEQLQKRNGPGEFKPTMDKEQREEVEKKRFGEMTPEEQQRWLAAKRMEAKTKREKEERERAKESELNRQRTHSAVQDMKEKAEEHAVQQMVAKKKKEEQEKIRVRNELRAKMAADKVRRQQELDRAMAEAKAQKEKMAAAGK